MPTIFHSGNNRAEVFMLPISAGDATLIMWSDGSSVHTVLIDAGLLKNEAVAYLQSIGIFHLDLVILSHPDLDHLGGLLGIMKSGAMSVDRIWCFDLAFLRDYVQTGRIPQPKPGTHEVLYRYHLLSTLDQFSDILEMANGRKVQVLQVSEGYKLSLGGMLLEVLYPPQNFYNALANPVALKRLLNRKIPADWSNSREDNDQSSARTIPVRKQKGRLTDKIEKPEMPEQGLLLNELSDERQIEPCNMQEEQDEHEGLDSPILPWKMVGTLYNNMSIVVKMSMLGGITSPSMLFPGDLSDWTTLILRQWPNLRADILKMPHHGSKHVTCDLKTLLKQIKYPLNLDWLDFPFWYPFAAPLSRGEFLRIYEIVLGDDPLSVIRNIINPSHVLLFPYPQHNLPSVQMNQFHSNVIANRVLRDSVSLKIKENGPIAARVLVGLERGDVTECK